MLITMPVSKKPPEGNRLANLLYDEREKRHLSKRELERLSGISRTTIMQIETGKKGRGIEAETFINLANAMKMSAIPFLEAIGAKFEIPIFPSGKPEEWDKHASGHPLRVGVYTDYARVHAGEAVDAIDYVYLNRPEKASLNIKGYRVDGDCMEPTYHEGETVFVDHDQAIENGDRVIALCDGKLHLAKLKIIGTEYWLENRYATRKMTDCQGIAKVIGHYGD